MVQRSCDVCELVDGDTTVKTVGYCSMCDAHMCPPCNGNAERRGKAWAKRTMQRLRRGLGIGLDNKAEEVQDGK